MSSSPPPPATSPPSPTVLVSTLLRILSLATTSPPNATHATHATLTTIATLIPNLLFPTQQQHVDYTMLGKLYSHLTNRIDTLQDNTLTDDDVSRLTRDTLQSDIDRVTDEIAVMELDMRDFVRDGVNDGLLPPTDLPPYPIAPLSPPHSPTSTESSLSIENIEKVMQGYDEGNIHEDRNRVENQGGSVLFETDGMLARDLFGCEIPTEADDDGLPSDSDFRTTEDLCSSTPPGTPQPDSDVHSPLFSPPNPSTHNLLRLSLPPSILSKILSPPPVPITAPISPPSPPTPSPPPSPIAIAADEVCLDIMGSRPPTTTIPVSFMSPPPNISSIAFLKEKDVVAVHTPIGKPPLSPYRATKSVAATGSTDRSTRRRRDRGVVTPDI